MKRSANTFLLILLSFTGFLAAVPAITPAAATPIWTGPASLVRSAGTNQYPAALQDADGTVWLAWSLHQVIGGGSQRIFYQTMVRQSSGWVNGTKTQLTTGTREITPSLAQLDLNTIILVWASNTTLNYHLVYEEYFLNNQTWSGTLNATNTTANDAFPSVAVARDGTAWLFWNRANATGVDQIYYKTMKNNIWSTETQLTAGANQNWQPNAIIGRDGRVMLTYAMGPQEAFQIMYNSYSTSWGTPMQVTPAPTVGSGYMDQHPTIVQDRNGTSWIFWERTIPIGTTSFEKKIFGKLDYSYGGPGGQNWINNPEIQLTVDQGGFQSIDQQPFGMQSARDKSIWLIYSTNTPRTEFDLDIIKAPITNPPVHDLLVLGTSISPSSCLNGISFVCFNTNPLQIYTGGYVNNYAVCSGPPLFMCPINQSSNVTFAILLWNRGDYSENVTVNLNATSTFPSIHISTQTVRNLPAGNQTTVTVNWNTTGVRPARWGFSISATIPVQPLLNKPDNLFGATNQVQLLPLGDVEPDGSVTITDVSIVLFDYGFSCLNVANCSPRYIAAQNADVNGNGIIDIVDVGAVLANFGTLT